MSRLPSQLNTSTHKSKGSLAALSSPREYLEFALTNKLNSKQVRETAFAFLRMFGPYVPESFSFANIQNGTPQAQQELIALLAAAANNFQSKKGD